MFVFLLGVVFFWFRDGEGLWTGIATVVFLFDLLVIFWLFYFILFSFYCVVSCCGCLIFYSIEVICGSILLL